MYTSIKKITSVFFLSASLYIAGAYFIDHQFSVNAITIPNFEEKPHVLSSDEWNFLRHTLSQHFSYLDRGHQSFAFVSADQKYVLKFFYVRDLKSFSLLPSPSEEALTKSQKKLDMVLEGYQVAFEKDRDNCGLLYVQLAPNPDLNLMVTVNDRFGIPHEVNLSKVPFVIQQKVIPTRNMIKSYLDKGDSTQTIEYLKKIADMYKDSYSRGIYDRDRNVIDNTGFIDGRVIRIDAGRLHYGQEWTNPHTFLPDLHLVMVNRIALFLHKYYPFYKVEIVSSIESYLD